MTTNRVPNVKAISLFLAADRVKVGNTDDIAF